jgi:hypothetical protein
MLHGGAPHLVAAAYAIVGWHMVFFGTALGLLSAANAVQGEFVALLPLPLSVFSFVVACYALKQAALALRAMMR